MDDWSAPDLGLLAGALGATYADTQTTKSLIGRGGQETNPLLGKKPSGQDLDHAAMLSAALGTIGASVLPESLRGAALGGWAGLESGLAYRNSRLTGKEKPTTLSHAVSGGPLFMGALGMLLGHAASHGLVDDLSVTPTEGGAMISAIKKF